MADGKNIDATPTLDEAIEHLKAHHPKYTGLGAAATLEQRAMRQIEIQEYEIILVLLQQFRNSKNHKKIEPTYEG